MGTLYFIDESHIDESILARMYGHGEVGAPVFSFAHRVSKKSWSLLMCVSFTHGIHHYEIVDTSNKGIDGNRFADYLRRLAETLPPIHVVVMDNASIHKDPHAQRALCETQMIFVYQSPYSPDLNPIEFVFGLIKCIVKRYEWSSDNLVKIIEDTIATITIEKVQSYYYHCRRLWDSDNDILS